MNYKKVSLILTTYNCKKNLEKTLKSIEEQDYPSIEVIIKDGGSTDGTLEVIKLHQDKKIVPIIAVSKPDKGIYDAMNQGYELSSGDVVAFFNERFTETNAVSKFVNAMKVDSSEYIGAHADLVYADEEKVIRHWKMGEGKISQGWMPGHPTLFLKREIYEKYGLYDTSLKISADYELMIRILKDERNQLAYIPETLVSMYYGGTSTGGLKGYLLGLKEAHLALKKNQVKCAVIIDIKRTLRVLCQFAKAKMKSN